MSIIESSLRKEAPFSVSVFLMVSSLILFAAMFVINPQALSQNSIAKQAAAERPCPGNCLKASDPRWQHMTVAGHPDSDLWIKFPYTGGSRSWNQNHIGEVIEYVNGKPENKGRCPICGGTTKVSNR